MAKNYITHQDLSLLSRHFSRRSGVFADFLHLQAECSELASKKSSCFVERKDLNAYDYYLGWCYDTSRKPLTPKVPGLSGWDFSAISRQSLVDNGKPDKVVRAYNSYMVYGLQARVAEIAFKSIYGLLSSVSRLKDLNVLEVENLPSYIDKCQTLPAYDFECMSTRASFDVKSNLYIKSLQRRDDDSYGGRSKRHEGLRGFFIRSFGAHSEEIYQGVVISSSNTDDLQTGGWDVSYVGELHGSVFLGWLRGRGGNAGMSGGRIPERLPSAAFCSPDILRLRCTRWDDERCALTLPDDLGVVLSDPRLALAYLCGVDEVGRKRLEQELCSMVAAKYPEGVLLFLQQVAGGLADEGFRFLEFVLWDSLTQATFRLLNHGTSSLAVHSLLDWVSSNEHFGPLWPVLQVQFGEGGSFLSRWIEAVLLPITEHWAEVRCPECGSSKFSLYPHRATAGGAVKGLLKCHVVGCRSQHVMTLITHCHKHSCYPLIVGQNATCSDCKGLKCMNEECEEACMPNCGSGSHASRGF